MNTFATAARPPAQAWLDQALRDPGSIFAGPEAVAEHPRLSLVQKIEILRSWEYDAAELAVAEEEGMRGPENNLLQRIVLTLAGLTHDRDSEFVTLTKQHGHP
jgi:hypothetical protein